MEYREALLLTEDAPWSQLDEAAKVEVLQAIENRMAQESNRSPCPVEAKFLHTGYDGVVLGSYDRESDTILVNASQFDSKSMYGATSERLVTTVLHEGRHAYQSKVAEGSLEHGSKDEASLWSRNLAEGNYVSFNQNPKLYTEQPVERDARSFAERQYELLVEERIDMSERAEARTVYEAQARPQVRDEQAQGETMRAARFESMSQ